jgi:hypothetical protein
MKKKEIVKIDLQDKKRYKPLPTIPNEEIEQKIKEIYIPKKKEIVTIPNIQQEDKEISCGRSEEMPVHTNLPAVPVEADMQEIKLIENNMESYKLCPKCTGKITKSKIIKEDNKLKQVIKCKNPLCDFSKEIILSI